jgi:hypothetical protein
MKKGHLFLLVFSLFTLFYHAASAGTRYLVPGVGLEGILEIGDSVDNKTKRHSETYALSYKVARNKNIIVLIKCDKCKFSTNRNIRIGSPKADVLRRYGAPRKEDKTGEAVLYRYPGIGFTIKNARVNVIYIFPRY